MSLLRLPLARSARPGAFAAAALLLCLAGRPAAASPWETFTALRDRVGLRLRQVQARADALAHRDPPVALDAGTRKDLDDLARGCGEMAGISDSAGAAAALPRLRTMDALARSLTCRLVPSEAGEVRGVWIHTYSPTDWDSVMRKVRDAGFNSVFVRVSRGGNAIYPSDIIPRDAWAEKAGGDELRRAIDAAHRYGLDFHAWRVCFHMNSAPKWYYARMAAQDRLVRNHEGKQSFWANPGDPRNTDLEYRAFMEIVRNYNVDGVHFDYIRYPDEPDYDYDYGQVSRAQFEKKIGRPVAHWPADVLNGPLQRQYEDWERSNINHLVERVYKGVKALKPNVQVSAAVWRVHRRYRAVIKQDWPLWIERGWLDFVVPMDYTTDLNVFADTVKTQVAMDAGRMPMVAGIGSWEMKDSDQVLNQVVAARRAGAAGYVLFDYGSLSASTLSALHAGAQQTPSLPAYDAPVYTFSIHGAVARKDAPYALLAGNPLDVKVAPEHRPGRPDAPADAVVRLEDPDGHPVPLSSMPAGVWQVVVRGKVGGRDFAVRGPLVEGLTPAEMAVLLGQDVPPHVVGTGLRVGVYAAGYSSDRILAALQADPQLCAFPLYHLLPDHLRAAQVIVLPQLTDVADLSVDAEAALRQWVADGGRLILTHDAVGFRYHPPAFPEIGKGDRLVKQTAVKVTLPGQAPWSFEHVYSDHIRVAPAAGDAVLVREAGSGAPVVVSGAWGKGTVVLSGILLGSGSGASASPEEARLLTELVRP